MKDSADEKVVDIANLRAQISDRDATVISQLKSTIDHLPAIDQPYEALHGILTSLQEILRADKPKDVFKKQEGILSSHLNNLKQNGYLVINILVTVLACISIMGILILGINGRLEENQKRRGHFFSFFASSEYEDALAAINRCRAVLGIESSPQAFYIMPLL